MHCDLSQPTKSCRAENCQMKLKYRLSVIHLKYFKICLCLFSLIFQSLLVSFLQTSHQSTGICFIWSASLWFDHSISAELADTPCLLQQFSCIFEFKGWMAVNFKRDWSHKVASNVSETAKTKFDFQSQFNRGRKKKKEAAGWAYGSTWGKSISVIHLDG